MRKRLCLCVGVPECSDPQLGPLPGAKVDASSVFEALTDSTMGQYDAVESVQLINPSKAEFVDALARLSYDLEIDTLTIYFAGHGVIIDSAYYLCCSDIELDKAAYSGLSLTGLFQIIGNAKPRHTNIIIDACHAAGVVHDVQSLIKPNSLGPANSFGVSILAMSATDQYAHEAPPCAPVQGGYGTLSLLKCLKGETDCHVNKSHLSLDDISKAIGLERDDQLPNFWSFNISGSPQFCLNKTAGVGSFSSFISIPIFEDPDSPTLPSVLSEELWKCYLDSKTEVELRELQNCLERGLLDLAEPTKQANFLIGLLDSFTARCSLADDGFATTQITAVFLFVAQKISDQDVADEVVAFIMGQLEASLEFAISSIHEGLKEDYFLVRGGGGHSEFFSLPIRITKVAAWSLFYLDLSNGNAVETARRSKVCEAILDALERDYSGSISLLSEEQAAYIIAISSLTKRHGLTEWGERFIGSLYHDYFAHGGRVARTSLALEDTYEFMKYRSLEEEVDFFRFSARPSELLFCLFAHYWNFDQLDVIRFDFYEIDGRHCTTYIPESYADFSDEVITNGGNLNFQIGHDVFTASDFDRFVRNYLSPAVYAASRPYDSIINSIAICTSLIYPDRVPWCSMGGLAADVL